MDAFPMFPLGTVLFPGLVLPLQVFEARYRSLLHDVLAADRESDREFGVCLIERGAEVGGSDVRTDVGTVARVREATRLADDRWGVVTVGTRRIRVVEWLADDPYPRARVVDVPDPDPGPGELHRLPAVTAQLRRALAKASELGAATAAATVEVSDDPVLASHQLAALAPVSTFDQHELLAATTVGGRLSRLEALLTEAEELLDLRLGDPGPG